MSPNDPPPFNVGRTSSIRIDWNDKLAPDKLAPSPKRKSLEFEHLSFTYNTDTGEFLVEDTDAGSEFSFDVAELSELKAALVAFGISLSPGSTVNYR